MSTPHRTLTALAVIIFTIIALAGTATAGTMAAAHTTFYHATPARHDKHHKHARRARRRQHSRPEQPAYKPTGIRYAAYDNEHCTAQDTVPSLQAHNANVLRYIVQPNPTETWLGVPCVQAARAAGYKVMLSIAFPEGDSPDQVRAWVAQVLNGYGHVWAASIGNEQNNITWQQYVAVWNVAEKAIPDSTLKVGVDAYPWSNVFSEDVIAAKPTGMDALAYHCYDDTNAAGQGAGINVVGGVADFAEQYRMPVFCDEMAPAPLSKAGWMQPVPVAAYNQVVSKVLAAHRNIEMDSYYVWPSIGAY